jgi:hypothetical protein
MWRATGRLGNNIAKRAANRFCIVLIGADMVCRLEPRWLLAARARSRVDVETMRRLRGSRGGERQAVRTATCCLMSVAASSGSVGSQRATRKNSLLGYVSRDNLHVVQHPRVAASQLASCLECGGQARVLVRGVGGSSSTDGVDQRIACHLMVKERLASGTGFVSHSIICTRQASETEEQPGQSRYGAGDGGVASEEERVSVLSVGVGWVSRVPACLLRAWSTYISALPAMQSHLTFCSAILTC